MTLGIDTSNYTTSAAVFDGSGGHNHSRLLNVDTGELGLRQSEAVFQHIKRLPDVIEKAMNNYTGSVSAIAVSARPRELDGSYMPCFLPGVTVARSMAAVMRVPVYEVSHQQGHIAAAAYSAGRPELLDRRCLVWHLSGGTTELLLTAPSGKNIKSKPVGGTNDISAGQLIDRAGRLLSLPFPSGKALDRLALSEGEFYPVKLAGCSFSLSGVENKLKAMSPDSPEKIATYALLTIAHCVEKATIRAIKEYGQLPVLFSGGVASSTVLRGVCGDGFEAVFAPAEYSTDNAYGVAVLAHRLLEG